jgi:hypothetical protein
VKWLDDYKRLRTFEDQLKNTEPKTFGSAAAGV